MCTFAVHKLYPILKMSLKVFQSTDSSIFQAERHSGNDLSSLILWKNIFGIGCLFALRQSLVLCCTLALHSWPKTILPPQPPKMLGWQTHATVPDKFHSSFEATGQIGIQLQPELRLESKIHVGCPYSFQYIKLPEQDFFLKQIFFTLIIYFSFSVTVLNNVQGIIRRSGSD